MSNQRYERKFYTNKVSKEELELLIKRSPAMFLDKFYERRVSSIYLDTNGFASYFDNISGAANRVKARVRWYDDLVPTAQNPTLEFKAKTGIVGNKYSHKLKDFDTTNITKKEFMKLVSNYPYVQNLVPVCVVSYMRKYYESATKSFRITIDSNLEYYKFDNHIHWSQKYSHEGIILELKYSKEDDKLASMLSGSLLPRVTRSSKYVNAINSIYGS